MDADTPFRQMLRPDGNLTRIGPALRDLRKGMDMSLADLVREDRIHRADGLAAAMDQMWLEAELRR